MFFIYILAYMLFSLRSSNSLELRALNNATIQIKRLNGSIDGTLFYEKNVKITSNIISLSFKLFNSEDVTPENIIFKLNNSTKKISIIDFNAKTLKKMYLSQYPYRNNATTYKIMFDNITSVQAGEYMLSFTVNKQNVSASSYISSFPVIENFTKPKVELEGDKLKITCLFDVFPGPAEVSWSTVQGSNLATADIRVLISNEHVQIRKDDENNRENSTLFIEKLQKNDSGIYMCTVVSNEHKDVALVRVSVLDRWGALYPFLGMLAEVGVLVALILAYEQYRIRSLAGKNGRCVTTVDEDNGGEAAPLGSGDWEKDGNGVAEENDRLRQREPMSRDV